MVGFAPTHIVFSWIFSTVILTPMKWRIPRHMLILILIIAIGAILRFYNLNWGDGYKFHPDERNIAFGISNLNYEKLDFNPDFWAYGSFPIYVTYFLALIIGKLGVTNALTFDGFILVGRILSAFLSVALIPLTYIIIQKINLDPKRKVQLGLLGALWITFSPGMIQFAHFATFETFLTFFYVLIALVAINLLNHRHNKSYIYLAILIGISIGTKIVSLALVPVLLFIHLVNHIRQNPEFKKIILRAINLKLVTSLSLIVTVAIIVSPYNLLDLEGFTNSMNYEGAVARGTLPVFYTQQFENTIPVIYQLLRVFPFILSIPLTIVSVIALVYFTLQTIRFILRLLITKTFIADQFAPIAIITAIVLLYLGFHLSLYVKWTRYMIPVIPFFIALSVAFLDRFIKSNKVLMLSNIIVSVAIIGSGVYFFQIYLNPDNRTSAADWAEQNLPTTPTVTTEEYDLGVMPFNRVFSPSSIQLLPLYDLENNRYSDYVFNLRDNADLFLQLSDRLAATRFRLPERYPQGFSFYYEFEDFTKWREIATFKRPTADCHFFNLWCVGFTLKPDETFNVFDHPEVKIFQNLQ